VCSMLGRKIKRGEIRMNIEQIKKELKKKSIVSGMIRNIVWKQLNKIVVLYNMLIGGC